MRLEIKILAILFLLVGIYLGVTLLPESQTDKKERLPEGLIHLEYESIESTFYPWVEMGQDRGSDVRCPHGFLDPGKTSRQDYLEAYSPKGPERNQLPNSFLQKHFCQWCKNRSNSENTEDARLEQLNDARLFSRRRRDQKINTVIAGGFIEEAEWKVDGSGKRTLTKAYCTHKYASVFQCWKVPMNDFSCRYVGECKTFHVPDYMLGTVIMSGHLETRHKNLHCLDPKGKHYEVNVSQLEPPNDYIYQKKPVRQSESEDGA